MNASALMQETLFLVPARGGSRRLPGKNGRPLGGVPLLGWTALALHAAGVPPAQAVLSTDDADLAAEGRRYGLQVPFLRPAGLATDRASSVDVALHALAWYEAARGAPPRHLVLLQPTSPFRSPETVQRALRLLAQGARAVLAVRPAGRSPRDLYRLEGRGRGAFLQPLGSGAEPLYTPSGALYAVGAGLLRRHRTLAPRGAAPLLTDPVEAIDIDTELDWLLAEAVVARGLHWRATERRRLRA